MAEYHYEIEIERDEEGKPARMFFVRMPTPPADQEDKKESPPEEEPHHRPGTPEYQEEVEARGQKRLFGEDLLD